MEIIFTFIFAFLLLTMILRLLNASKHGKRDAPTPPVPWGRLPILGHLPILGLEPHKVATVWKERYGPIVSVQFGSFPCIIISDYQLAKEAFAELSFAGRPSLPTLLGRSGGVTAAGIVAPEGRVWREQRTFTHRRLRELGGFGTKTMEAKIMDQVGELLKTLHAEQGRPTATQALFNVFAMNALWAIVAGSPLDASDRTLRELNSSVTDALRKMNILTQLSECIPWIGTHLPDWISRRSHVERLYKPTLAFLQPHIDEHWRTHVKGEPRDFIDVYIDEILSTRDPASSFHPTHSANSLTTVLLDLFQAGADTTATTLEWVCFLLAAHPSVQERLVAEIQAVIGGSRSPSLADRRVMPYTEAVLHEVLRYRPILPLAVFHSTVEPTVFHGYNIPKDTLVYINVHEAHFNRELWGDPERFRPERWLSDDGSICERRAGFLPFSTGKRACLGEQLARDELFLFTVALLQEFTIYLHREPNQPPPSLEPKLGGTTLGPQTHRLMFCPKSHAS